MLLVIAYAFIAAVYINYMQRFGVLNNEICAAGQVNGFSKGSLYLAGNSIAVKNGCAIIVEGKYFGFIGSNPLQRATAPLKFF